MADQDQIAAISVPDAELLARMSREWAAFKRAGLAGTLGEIGDGRARLPTAIAWIILTGSAAMSGRTKFECKVVGNPYGHTLSPPDPVAAEELPAFCTLEFGDTATTVDAQAMLGGAPVLALLYWTFVESGNPDDGYWAWWFTPGGGSLPTGEFQHMVYRMVSDNQGGWGFMQAHDIPE